MSSDVVADVSSTSSDSPLRRLNILRSASVPTLKEAQPTSTDLLVTTTALKGHLRKLGRDPVVIERSNLVNISKLVVKELIEQSLRYGRMLDSDHMPLQHFFIVLEHVLRHGLRPKKIPQEHVPGNRRVVITFKSVK